jgi:hypothetical protein
MAMQAPSLLSPSISLMPKLPQMTRGTLMCMAAYAATMSATVWLLWSARASVLASLDDPAERAHWQEWKEREESQAMKGSPVERRPPVSDEPPSLVLMRDSFGAVVSSCLILGTVLFAFLAIFVRGVIAGREPTVSSDDDDPSGQAPLFARRAGE